MCVGCYECGENMERSSAYLLRGDGSASLGGCGVGCVCLLFLVSPRGAWFDRVCSLAGAHCTPLSLPPPSYPPLLSSSALPTSLSFFLIPSFILSAHVFLGEAKRSHSSHNPPPEAPPSLSLSPSFFQSITLSLSPPLSPFFLSLIHFFFCLVSTSVLCLPLFLYPQPPPLLHHPPHPPPPLPSLPPHPPPPPTPAPPPPPPPLSPSLSLPQFPGKHWHHMILIPFYTHTYTHTHVYHNMGKRGSTTGWLMSFTQCWGPQCYTCYTQLCLYET